jgi:4-hydroxy 2-oxovalerate aldolase
MTGPDLAGESLLSRPEPDQPPSAGQCLLLDVTLRDGGYINGHGWTIDEAAGIVRSVDRAGIPLIEVGYLRSGDDPLRPAASCPPYYLDPLAAEARQAGLVVMVRPGEVDPRRLTGLRGHGVRMVRVLVARGAPAPAEPYVRAARDAGLLVATNITRVSEAEPAALVDAVGLCAGIGADVVYLADSNGSLFPDGVRARVAAAMSATTVPIGFHAHDNLGLAFINSWVATRAGARALDASVGGIGKGGGNLRLELIAAHRVLTAGADYRLDPLLRERGTIPARLRMLAEGASGPLVAGLLDVNLDRAGAFQERAARHGFDSLLHDARGASGGTAPTLPGRAWWLRDPAPTAGQEASP